MLQDYFKTLPQYLLPKAGISALAGRFANVEHPPVKNYLIKHFIEQYGVNMAEALEEDPYSYKTFNDFFIRRLKPICRPVNHMDIISPVDGTLSEFGEVQNGQLIQAKGRYYSVDELLGETIPTSNFYNSFFATFYLSPKDYHRVHVPIPCRLQSMLYIPGKLFSVQPATTRVIPKLFARNERLVIFFDTSAGPMAMVMVGATIVGAIGTSWHGDLKRSRRSIHFDYSANEHPLFFQKAEEIGYFKLGSTVILLFADKAKIKWQEQLTVGQSIRLGEALGDVLS